MVDQDGSFCLSILKSADGDPACSHRYFYEYDAPLAGEGRFIHTYQENAEPLPSFEGEPAGCLSPPLTLRPWLVRCGPA